MSSDQQPEGFGGNNSISTQGFSSAQNNTSLEQFAETENTQPQGLAAGAWVGDSNQPMQVDARQFVNAFIVVFSELF